MDTDYFKDSDYTRTTYNAIINSKTKTTKTTNNETDEKYLLGAIMRPYSLQ